MRAAGACCVGQAAPHASGADRVERRRSASSGADPNATDLARIFPDHAAVCVSIVLGGR
jgi:hypothetical protein